MIHLKWLFHTIQIWYLVVICYLITPYIATRVKYIDEDKVETKLTEKIGKPRPYLIEYWYDFQSFDGSLDYYWYWISKSAWLRKYFDQDYYDNHAWLRWFTRCLWIWRNPAYGYKLKYGYYQRGVDVLYDDDPNDDIWKLNKSCSLTRIFQNERGEYGFLYRIRKFNLELVFGYKYPFDEKVFDKAMIATRIKFSRTK